MEINNLNKRQLYNYLRSLTDEEKTEALLEIFENDSFDLSEDINNIEKQLQEDINNRNIFYWRLYNLVDRNNDLTTLGFFYSNLFNHHFLKAFKLFINFDKSTMKKNEILYTNEKANEYLFYFKSYVKEIGDVKVKHII